MTVRLLEGIQLAGIHQPVGSILTLAPDDEAGHVSSNKAVYTTLPDIGDDGVPVLATKTVTGVVELYGLQLIPGLVVDSPEAAGYNTTIINNAISKGGSFALCYPGIVWTDAPGRVPGWSSIYFGAGTEVKGVAGPCFSLFENFRHSDAAIATLGAGELTFSGQTATLARAGIGASFPVGEFISVLDSTTVGVCGTFGPILSSSANQITWFHPLKPAASPAVGTIKVFQADGPIKLWGPGKLNPNAENQAGDIHDDSGHCTRWKKVIEVALDDAITKQGYGWTHAFAAIGVINSRRLKAFPGPYGQRDGINVTAPARLVNIEDFEAYTGDVAIGLNAWGITATSDHPAEFPIHCGEIGDVTVNGLDLKLTAAVGVALWGEQSSKFGKVVVKKVRGNCASAVVGLNQYTADGSNFSNIKGDSLHITDIDVVQPAGAVVLTGAPAANWKKIEVDDVVLSNGASAVYLDIPNAYKIDHVSVHGISCRGTPGGDVVAIVGGVKIGKYDFYDNAEMVTPAGYYSLSRTFAEIGQYNARDMTYTMGGAAPALRHGGGYPIKTVNLVRISGYGGSNLFYQDNTAGSSISEINGDSLRLNGASEGLVNLSYTAQPISTKVKLSKPHIDACGAALLLGAPADVVLDGYTDSTSVTYDVVLFQTSGNSYSLKVTNSKTLKTSFEGVSAGALVRFSGGSDMKLADGAHYTATPVVGDMFWQGWANWAGGSGTNKAGMYGYNGGGWTKIFGPA